MLLITAVGPDRPGMVHALAAILAEAGCNIEDTTMTRLSGEFAMILIVTAPPDVEVAALAQQLAPLESSHGLVINCKEIGDAPPAPAEESRRYILSVHGPERPGIVAAITGALAARDVNITDLQTRVVSAGRVYIMVLQLEFPAGLDVHVLQNDLSAAAAAVGVEVSLRPLEEDYL